MLKFDITHLRPGNHLLHLFVGSFKRDEAEVGMLCWVVPAEQELARGPSSVFFLF